MQIIQIRILLVYIRMYGMLLKQKQYMYNQCATIATEDLQLCLAICNVGFLWRLTAFCHLKNSFEFLHYQRDYTHIFRLFFIFLYQNYIEH